LPVSSARVLVIDGDEWIARLLARVLEERGYKVDVCSSARESAREGYQRAVDTAPDCIVSSPELPDIDGLWLARRIRTEGASVSRVPILFIGEIPDKNLRVQAFQAGVDVFLRSPVSNDEVVAQVDALVKFSKRFRDTPSAPPNSASKFAALRGDLGMFPLASLLMMFELERRSGTIEVVSSSGTRATLALADGLFASTEIGGEAKPALDVLRTVLSWRAGRFAFHPRDLGTLPTPRASVGALVLEAMRLEDEKKTAH
jgi:CheY-like chemotaxis protein